MAQERRVAAGASRRDARQARPRARAGPPPRGRAIRSAADLQRLIEALRAHGYDEPLLRKIAHENWLRVLDLAIG